MARQTTQLALTAAEQAFQVIFHADNLTGTKLEGIATKLETLGRNLKIQANKLGRFQIDIRWKTRVISVPNAVKNIKDLITQLSTGFKEKVDALRQPFITFKGGLAAFQELSKAPDPGLSGFNKAIQEIENFIQLLNGLVGDVSNAIDAAADLRELFDRILNDIQHLDDVFLPSSSARKKTTQTYYKRQGKGRA